MSKVGAQPEARTVTAEQPVPAPSLEGRSDGNGGIKLRVVADPAARTGLAPRAKPMPPFMTRSGRLGDRPNISARPKSQPVVASSFGPFASRGESVDAQRALTKLRYGEVATTSGAWGPKSHAAFHAFTKQYGVGDAEGAKLLKHLGDKRGVDVSDPMLSISHPELQFYPAARLRLRTAISAEISSGNDSTKLGALLRQLGQLDDLASAAKSPLSTDIETANRTAFFAMTAPERAPKPAA